MHEKTEIKAAPSDRLTMLVFLAGVLAQAAVNLLGKVASPDLTPLMLSGSRLLVGAALLFCFGLFLGLRAVSSSYALGLYAAVGLLNMGIPHALLFMGMRNFGARAIDAAIVEAAIPGIILVYLFAGRQRPSFRSCCYMVLILVGMVGFLGGYNVASGNDEMTGGSWLLVVSAGVSSIGLISDDLITWPAVKPAKSAGLSNWFQVDEKLSLSWQKAMFGAMFSGGVTLLTLPISNRFLDGISTPERFDLPIESLPGVLGLSLAGTCVVWLSIFWLIQSKKLDLVVLLLAIVPIVTLLYESLAACFLSPINQPLYQLEWQQWVGGAVLLVFLGALVFAELGTPGIRSGGPIDVEEAT